MKAKIPSLSLLLFSLATVAGTKDSGGDPLAQEFSKRGLKIALFLMENPKDGRFGFAVNAFEVIAKKYEHSISDEKVVDLIHFVEDKPTDKFGAPKPAITNEDTGLIQVHRQSWQSFNDKERYTLVAMEYMVSLRIANRYEEAERLVNTSYDYLKKADTGVYQRSDFRSDRLQQTINFKLDIDSVVIDGGFLLRGDAPNQRGVEFLRNPRSQTDKLDIILKTLHENRTVYLLYMSEIPGLASIIGLDLNLRGGKIVLNRQQRLYVPGAYASNPKKDDPCHPANTTLSTVERYTDCVAENSELYRPTFGTAEVQSEVAYGEKRDDQIRVIAEALELSYRSMLGNFSRRSAIEYSNRMNVKIPTGLTPRSYNEEIFFALVSGQGLSPSLVAAVKKDANDEITTLPFWYSTSANKAEARTVMALKLLERQNLVYEDTNFEYRENGKDFRGPMVLPRATRDAHDSGMRYRVNPGPLGEELPLATVEAGYFFSMKEQDWIPGKITRDDAHNPDIMIDPVELGFDHEYLRIHASDKLDKHLARVVFRETLIRTSTEKMSSAQRIQLHLRQMQGRSAKFRLQYLENFMNSLSSDWMPFRHLVREEDYQSALEQCRDEVLKMSSDDFEDEEKKQFVSEVIENIYFGKSISPESVRQIFTHIEQNAKGYLRFPSYNWILDQKNLRPGDHPYAGQVLALEIKQRKLTEKELRVFLGETFSSRPQEPGPVLDDRSEMVRAELLQTLLNSGKLSNEDAQTARRYIVAYTEINAWKDTITGKSEDEKVEITLRETPRLPTEATANLLRLINEKTTAPANKTRLLEAWLSKIQSKNFNELNITLVNSTDYRSEFGALQSLVEYVTADDTEISSELRRKALDLLTAKWKDGSEAQQNKYTARLVHFLQYRDVERDRAFGMAVLKNMNSMITRDSEENRGQVKTLIMLFTPRKPNDVSSREYGRLLKYTAEAKASLLELSENANIPAEYRQRLKAIANR